jgi:ribose/xylose/arabinose/galactoside ABC-type transport system permease subunit
LQGLQRQLREIAGPLFGVILIWIIIFAMAPIARDNAWDSIENVLENATGSGLFIMCCGMTIALIGNCLDLSVGSIYALVSVVVGQLLKAGVPIPVAILLGLGAGALCGVINGAIVVRTGIPTLIATLGTQMAFRGVADMIGAGVDMEQFGKTFDWLGSGLIGPGVCSLIAFLVIWFILAKTRFGFQVFAQGGNEEVARLAGIPVKRNIILVYMICGIMAGLASIVYTARVDFAYVDRGQGWELLAIAGVVIGGTSMFGGIGGVGKTVLGVLIYESIFAGLIYLHYDAFWQQVATGAVLIVAVWIDSFQRRANASRRSGPNTASKRSLWSRVGIGG